MYQRDIPIEAGDQLPSFGLASRLSALAAAVRDGSLLAAQIALAHVAGSFRRWSSV